MHDGGESFKTTNENSFGHAFPLSDKDISLIGKCRDLHRDAERERRNISYTGHFFGKLVSSLQLASLTSSRSRFIILAARRLKKMNESGSKVEIMGCF